MKMPGVASVVLVAALCAVAGCVSGPPRGEDPIKIRTDLKIKRPPASALPQEAATKSYAELLQKGYAFIGTLGYTTYRFGATKSSARKATLEEAQKHGADLVWLSSNKLYDLEFWQSNRPITGVGGNLVWTRGTKKHYYILSYATLFVLDEELASQQMSNLEKLRAASTRAMDNLNAKVEKADTLWKSYESAHRGTKETRSAYWIMFWVCVNARNLDRAGIGEGERCLGDAMEGFSKYWVRDSATKKVTGITNDVGDLRELLLALLDVSNYVSANKQALHFQEDNPALNVPLLDFPDGFRAKQGHVGGIGLASPGET